MTCGSRYRPSGPNTRCTARPLRGPVCPGSPRGCSPCRLRTRTGTCRRLPTGNRPAHSRAPLLCSGLRASSTAGASPSCIAGSRRRSIRSTDSRTAARSIQCPRSCTRATGLRPCRAPASGRTVRSTCTVRCCPHSSRRADPCSASRSIVARPRGRPRAASQ
eukprot:4194477-Prymnesium_polylepis.1